MKKINCFILCFIIIEVLTVVSSAEIIAQTNYVLYVTYKLPTDPNKISDASNLESECTNKHAVCMQACQIGDGKEDCQNRCEQAFRQCLLGIDGVKFWLAACVEGNCQNVEEIIPLTREEALDIRLNDIFTEINPGYYYKTGTYVTVSSTGYTFKRTRDGEEISFPGSYLIGQAISNHFDTEYPFKDALFRAIENGQDGLTESLLSRGLNPNGGSYGYLPIAAAIKKDKWDLVKTLVEKYHADVTKFTESNGLRYSLVELAALSNDINNVKLFIDNGADINARETSYGITTGYPLQAAINSKNLPMVKFLISNGADLKNSDYLASAVYQNDIEMLKYLISQGVDVNYYSIETPLTIAAYNGSLPMVKVLLQNGAKVNKINNFGETALDLAERKNHKEVADYLKSKGAKHH